MPSTDYYNDPSLIDAQKAAESAGTTAANYSSAASLLPQKLREAVMAKVDYNKDIISQQDKAQADYFAAPAQARAKYADPSSENYIFNPFQAEKLVTEARTQAYAPYATLTDILGQRLGSLSDIINAGVGGFNSSVNAAQSSANSASQRFSDLLALAKAKTDQANTLRTAGSSTNSLDSLISAWLGQENGSSQVTEPKPTWTYSANSAASKSGVTHFSPGAEWVWDPSSGDWYPVVD